MVFNSFEFLVFLLVFLAFFFRIHGRPRLWCSLGFSFLFYGWHEWRFLGPLCFSILAAYVIGLGLERQSNPDKRRWLLILGIVTNVGLLGFYKYTNFFVGSLVAILGHFKFAVEVEPIRILLPIGISFFTLRSISYIIDIYRHDMNAERSLLRFANYLALFPLLTAGPIVRGKALLPQLHSNKEVDWDRFLEGASLVVWGYFLKIVVADSLAPVVDNRFAYPEAHTSLSLLAGVFFYAFQIYYDFSGYSNIAIGIGKILGFDFGINFDRPYFSASFSEFWRRWHISLSSWLRDYLYIPLGGSRNGRLNTYRNLLLTMLLAGLWHGANWNFIIWGGLHGFYLGCQHAFRKAWDGSPIKLFCPKSLSTICKTVLVFLAVCLAWIFFRAPTPEQAFFILARILSFDNMTFADVPSRFLIVKGLILITLLVCVEGLSFKVTFINSSKGKLAYRFAAGAVIFWFMALFGSFTGSTFIYSQF